MASSVLFSFCILAWTLCVLPTEAYWFLQARSHSTHAIKRLRSLNSDRFGTSHETQGWEPNDSSTTSETSNDSSPSELYTLPVPSARIIEPTLTSQGMIISSIIPLYEVCNTPGSNTTSCSTVFETITTSSCSTILTYAFTKATISDCNQNITFSTQSSYSLATATVSTSTAPALRKRRASSQTSSSLITTYVQSIVSYYIAPWQSLAANTPSNITVLVCDYDFFGNETCSTIQEVWVIYTEYVPVITTSTLIISTMLASVRLPSLSLLKKLILSARRVSSRAHREHNSHHWPIIRLHPNRVLFHVSECHDFDINYP